MPTAAQPTPRMRHYGVFYGLDPVPVDDGRPLAIVMGNCQAESIRVLLGDRPDSSVRTVRVPPVFELGADDLPHLARLLNLVDIIVTQPVRDDYRALPLGTSQIARHLPRGARVVRIPPLRYAGLYPTHVIVRSGPAGEAGDPPFAPYHDLRVALRAVGAAATLTAMPAGIRGVAASSVDQVAARERRHDTVIASDLLTSAGVDAAHTINHPGNPVLVGLARRVEERLSLPVGAVDPGRTLLKSIHAPLEEPVLAALRLPTEAARAHWTIEGAPVSSEEVAERHLRWYEAWPGLAEHVLDRNAATLGVLRGA